MMELSEGWVRALKGSTGEAIRHAEKALYFIIILHDWLCHMRAFQSISGPIMSHH